MNYLFVMPRFIKSSGEPYIFPLGIAYVSASLKRIRTKVYNVNLNLDTRLPKEVLREAIEKWDIQVLLTGGLSPNFNQIKELIVIAKTIRPSIITMVGGGMVTATPKVIMDGIPNLDIGMIGEGEHTICELADAIENKQSLQTIKGIIFRDQEGKCNMTEERADIEELDELPFPDYDGFGFHATNGISICTSRSCPFQCTFCFHTCGIKYRARSLESIFTEIDWLVKKYDVKELGILDELFATDEKKMSEFCDRIKVYHIKWSCQMRVDKLNLELLKKMKDSGCTQLSLGIENASNEILKSMQKHITIEQIDRALLLAKEAKINPFGNLLLGDKEDTKETVECCLRWYESHSEYQLGYNKIMVLPGSKLYQYAVVNGYIQDELKYLEDSRFTINVTKMNTEEYNECVHKIDEAVMKRLYQAHHITVNEITQESVSISCECPTCKKEMTFSTIDFSGSQNYVCTECGQNFNVSLYKVFEREIEQHLKKILEDENRKIVMWGLANVGIKIAYLCNMVSHPNFFLVDKAVSKQGEFISGTVVRDPEEIASLEIEYLIVGTNDSITNKVIKENADKIYKKVKYIMNVDDFLLSCIQDIN